MRPVAYHAHVLLKRAGYPQYFLPSAPYWQRLYPSAMPPSRNIQSRFPSPWPSPGKDIRNYHRFPPAETPRGSAPSLEHGIFRPNPAVCTGTNHRRQSPGFPLLNFFSADMGGQ